MQNSLLSTCASNNNNGSTLSARLLACGPRFRPQFLGLIRQRREKDPRECFKKKVAISALSSITHYYHNQFKQGGVALGP